MGHASLRLVQGEQVSKGFCGEIQYTSTDENGNEIAYIHSDICWCCRDEAAAPPAEEYRKFLHNLLDEWLDAANGTGAFWVGNPEHFVGWGG